MRITIVPKANDMSRFLRSWQRDRDLARSMDEIEVIGAVEHALGYLAMASAPEHVRKRIAGVQRLIMQHNWRDDAMPCGPVCVVRRDDI